MAVMNVSSVWAATTDYIIYSVNVSSDNKTKTWDFTKNSPSSSTNLNVGDTIQGIIYSTASSGNSKLQIGYLSINTGAHIQIPVPADSAGKLSITASGDNATRYMVLDDNREISMSGTNEIEFTAEDLANGYIELSASGGECKIGKLEITLSTGEFEAISYSSGELTVSSTGNGTTTITVDGVGATSPVSLNGGEEIVVTATPDNGYKATIKDGTTILNNPYTFTADGNKTLTVEYTEIQTLSAITSNELDSGVILKADDIEITSFTEETVVANNKFAIGSSVTIDSSSKTFTDRNGNTTTVSKRFKLGSAGSSTERFIKFKLADDVDSAKVFVAAMSSSSGNTRTLQLYDGNYSAVTNQSLTNDGNSIGTATFDITAPGTYYLASTNSGFNVSYVEVYSASTEPSVDPDPSTSTNISLDFRNGAIIGGTSQATYYITDGVATTTESADYDVKITNVKTHNDKYGLQQSGSFPVITFNKVVGPAKITLGSTNYGGYFNASSDGSGKFLNADGISVTEVNGYSSSDGSNVYYYTGADTATITLTGTKGSTAPTTIYISTLAVETIEETALPAEVPANLNVKVTAAGTNTGDTLTITDIGGNTYKAAITDGVADFTGKGIITGNATVSAEGYTLDPATITIAENTNEYQVTATPTATEVIADNSDTSVLYAGYAAKTGYSVYNTVQAAVNAASSGATIQLAPKTFTETVVINKPNIKIIGTARDTSVITYNDSEIKNDTYFHGATLAVLADGFSAENLTVQNTAEEDGTAGGKNATALSMDYDSLTANVTITNCNLLAFRDTVYTGKVNSNVTLTLDNCLITGFQDVICGSGNVTIKDCTMDTSRAVTKTYSNTTARLFAPSGYSDTSKTTVYKAENLIIKSTDSKTGTIYFARAWDGYTKNADGTKEWDKNTNIQVIIDGYTVDSSASSAFAGETLYGFEADGINCTGITKNYFWLVRKTTGTGNYNTTLASINETPVNTFSALVDEGNSVYRFIGTINSALVDDADVSSIGFAVTYGDKTVNMSDSTVYTDGSSTYYTVNFAENIDTSQATTLKPYVNYKTYDIEGGIATQAKTIDYSADVSTAESSAN